MDTQGARGAGRSGRMGLMSLHPRMVDPPTVHGYAQGPLLSTAQTHRTSSRRRSRGTPIHPTCPVQPISRHGYIRSVFAREANLTRTKCIRCASSCNPLRATRTADTVSAQSTPVHSYSTCAAHTHHSSPGFLANSTVQPLRTPGQVTPHHSSSRSVRFGLQDSWHSHGSVWLNRAASLSA